MMGNAFMPSYNGRLKNFTKMVIILAKIEGPFQKLANREGLPTSFTPERIVGAGPILRVSPM